jgi:hypothetical protein
MMEGEKMESYNKYFLKLKCSSIWSFLCSWSFLSLFSILFLPLFLSFFYDPSLEDLRVLMILVEKNHFFKNLFSNEMG